MSSFTKEETWKWIETIESRQGMRDTASLMFVLCFIIWGWNAANKTSKSSTETRVKFL